MIVASLFTLVLMAGCSRADGSRKVKIVWAIYGGDTLLPIFLSTIQDFETKHPNIEVEPLQIPGNYYQKITVMLAGRTPPDVFWMGQSFAEFAARGNFLDLSDRIIVDPDIDLGEYHPKVVTWYSFGSKQYGIPYGVDVQFIVYNKSAFREAGLPYPKDGWTLDEFLHAAKELTIDRDGDGRIDQYGFRGVLPEAMWGAQFVALDGSRAMCNAPEMVQWANFMLDLRYKWKVAPPPPTDVPETEEMLTYIIFRQGKAAMIRQQTFNISHLREKCAEVDWDVVSNPIVPDRPRAHWASSAAFLVAADTKHPDEAWLFAKHLLGDRFQMVMTSESLPSNRRVAQRMVDENILKPENLQSVVDAANFLHPYPRIPNLNELLGLWTIATEKVFQAYGTSRWEPPEKAFEEAARRINETIAKRKRGGGGE